MILGLRIDVDTLKGTRDGVPNLCKLLSEYSIKASFFFSVGPDNMGRHLWRLIRPDFLIKMLRTKAPNLYGWDILLKGTLWPGPVIGKKAAPMIRAASEAGHEIGLHAWDHHRWQMQIEDMTRKDIQRSLKRGFDVLMQITGKPPVCSAVPAWKCTNLVLEEKYRFPFFYNSDCRGENIFFPLLCGCQLSQPQIPVTLPTYDELIGRGGISDENYNEHILSQLKPDGLNVLAIHAEVEGISRFSLFQDFLKQTKARKISLAPLGSLLEQTLPVGQTSLTAGKVPGREGWCSCQMGSFA
jgi:undecaprenyl phosphate-alpha-L-ara4FN deformylase